MGIFTTLKMQIPSFQCSRLSFRAFFSSLGRPRRRFIGIIGCLSFRSSSSSSSSSSLSPTLQVRSSRGIGRSSSELSKGSFSTSVVSEMVSVVTLLFILFLLRPLFLRTMVLWNTNTRTASENTVKPREIRFAD